MTLKVGTRAPAFKLRDGNDNLVSLRNFTGKYLILYFYPKDMTPGCTVEAQQFQKNLDQLRKLGAEVAGVSKDSPATHCKFAKKYALGFTLLSDPTGEVIEKYDAWKKKTVFGKTSMGIARITYLIDPSGKIIKVYPKVSPQTHAQDLLADIMQLT